MDLLFDIPWYIPVSIAAAGIALFVYGNNRTRTREKYLGLLVIGLALLLTAISWFVDTPAERVIKRTRQFVDAVVAKDSGAISALLDANATAFAWTKPDIVSGAVHYADETGLTGSRIIGLNANWEGNVLSSYLTVWSQHTGKARLPITDMNSQWKLEWANTTGEWVIRNIIPLQVGQAQREQIEQQYLSRPAARR